MERMKTTFKPFSSAKWLSITTCLNRNINMYTDNGADKEHGIQIKYHSIWVGVRKKTFATHWTEDGRMNRNEVQRELEKFCMKVMSPCPSCISNGILGCCGWIVLLKMLRRVAERWGQVPRIFRSQRFLKLLATWFIFFLFFAFVRLRQTRGS